MKTKLVKLQMLSDWRVM